MIDGEKENLARQKEILEALDAIHARCERGEITAAEADALHEAELERMNLRVLLLQAAQPPVRGLARHFGWLTRMRPKELALLLANLAWLIFLVFIAVNGGLR